MRAQPAPYNSIISLMWCPFSRKMGFHDEAALSYPDGRCIGWLYICEITGEVVVHNKRCTAPMSWLPEYGGERAHRGST